MVRWVTAFQNYALAAEAAEVHIVTVLHMVASHVFAYSLFQVWNFAAALAHMRICLQISGMHLGRLKVLVMIELVILAFAVTAKSEDRGFSLGQIYDEIVRKDWTEKATRGEPSLTCI